jgi:hypothetical protein
MRTVGMGTRGVLSMINELTAFVLKKSPLNQAQIIAKNLDIMAYLLYVLHE